MAILSTYLPEYAIAAYAQEQPSVRRMILEARWAHLQRDATFERPDTFHDDQVRWIKRAHLIHLGALYDVFAVRGAHDMEVHEAARGLGTNLLAHDGFHLPTTRLSGIDYLRTAYAALHGHIAPLPRTDTPANTPDSKPAEQPFPCPPESRLIRTMLWSYTVAQDCRNQGRLAEASAQLREHQIARGLLLWSAAALAPADLGAAQDAAVAGHHVRGIDGRPRTGDESARRYLLEAYREAHHDDDDQQPHEVDCPGGCGGDGVVMVTLTWDDQGDGIFVPVWAEPVDCTEGVPQEHDPGCTECLGHGYTYGRGERNLCLCLRSADLTEQPGLQ
ncbi:hypothetical protein ACIREO_23720 [Streptomyces sp. NPDC102441]|uniref:hypothetical protein n=1 Tax=Streptomyces sp. NPDC102441 TaxID=3366176 RepID=UPI0037F81A45